MIHDPGAIDATLAAALGDDSALIAELRRAFTESCASAAAAVAAAPDAPDRIAAARRLKGLAASFGATELMARADEVAAAPVDGAVLARLARAVAAL